MKMGIMGSQRAVHCRSKSKATWMLWQSPMLTFFLLGLGFHLMRKTLPETAPDFQKWLGGMLEINFFECLLNLGHYTAEKKNGMVPASRNCNPDMEEDDGTFYRKDKRILGLI